MMTHKVAKQPRTTVYDLLRAQYTIPVPITISKVRSLHKYNTLSFSHKTYSGAAKATVTPGLMTSYDYMRWVNFWVSRTIVRNRA